MATMSDYIDFSGNEELWKEEKQMNGLGECVYRDGLEEGIEAMILENIEDQVPMECIISKLQKYFHLTKEKAEIYYKEFAPNA